MLNSYLGTVIDTLTNTFYTETFVSIDYTSTEKKCLTIDTRDVNKLGQSKFRTGAKNGHERICYFNRNKKDRIFNRFLVVRKETSVDEIIFSIVNLIDKSNNLENTYYEIGDELKEFNNDRLQFKQTIPRSSSEDIPGTGQGPAEEQQ